MPLVAVLPSQRRWYDPDLHPVELDVPKWRWDGLSREYFDIPCELHSDGQIRRFPRDPEKERRIRENDRFGGLCKSGSVRGPQKLNDGSQKTIHPGAIDRGLIVLPRNISESLLIILSTPH